MSKARANAPIARGRTRKGFPGERCLHELFEAQVRLTPGATALTCDGASLTYDKLNRRANRVAHALRAQGVRPEALVPLYLERSFEMVIGVLGILKAGAALSALPDRASQRGAVGLGD